MKPRSPGLPQRREGEARERRGHHVTKRTGSWIRYGTASLVCALLIVSVTPAFAVSAAGEDPPRRDEFGVIPEDAIDRDLTLPDRFLDRTWPGPGPGDHAAPPPGVAPDEDEIDPFEDEVAPAPSPQAPSFEDHGRARRPDRPLIGPDGKQDAGSLSQEADPVQPDAIEPDIHEPSELEDDSRPSPLDRDDDEYNQETDDPGEW